MVGIAGCHGSWKVESDVELVRRSEKERKWKERAALITLPAPPPRNHKRTITTRMTMIVYLIICRTIFQLYPAWHSFQFFAPHIRIAPGDFPAVLNADVGVG